MIIHLVHVRIHHLMMIDIRRRHSHVVLRIILPSTHVLRMLSWRTSVATIELLGLLTGWHHLLLLKIVLLIQG
jgi:hypothetical protein